MAKPRLWHTSSRIPSADVTLRQIHSAEVHNAHGLSDRANQGDGLATGEASLKIGVRTADCVPILLLDAPESSSRRSRRMARNRRPHCRARDCGHERLVWERAGGRIRRYQVLVFGYAAMKSERKSRPHLPHFFPEWQPLTGKRHLDLVEANRRQLQTAGSVAIFPTAAFVQSVCRNISFRFVARPLMPGVC